MAMTQRQNTYQNQVQKTAITAYLTQSMKFLGMGNDELYEQILAASADNPTLDLHEDIRCQRCGAFTPPSRRCTHCGAAVQDGIDPAEDLVFVSSRRELSRPGVRKNPNQDIDLDISDLSDDDISLPEFVLQQIGPDMNHKERLVAATILSSLDENGYLITPIPEIARYHNCLPSFVVRIKKIIQRAMPIGVASENSQEVMLAQLDHLLDNNLGDPKLIELARLAITHAIVELSRHNHTDLAKKLGVTKREAVEIDMFITDNLTPHPARLHWGSNHKAPEGVTVYYNPDVIISEQANTKGKNYKIEVVMPTGLLLRIQPQYKDIIKSGQGSLEESQGTSQETMKNLLDKGVLFIKALNLRNATIVRLMKILVASQREFIAKGDAYLKPITRAEIAERLDLHEGTISRAVKNKAVQLPSGRIIPLSKFFDRSLAPRTILKTITDQEEKPLTDSALAILLGQKGYPVKRRTIAKYRSMEGILPAHLRGQKN